MDQETSNSPAYVGVPELKKRGWTDAMILEFLGEPDWLVRHPRRPNAASRRLYETGRVDAAETHPEWERRREGQRSSATPRPAPPTQRREPATCVHDMRAVVADRRKAVAIAQRLLGLPVDAIAAQLNVKPDTVRNYVRQPRTSNDPETAQLLELAQQQKLDDDRQQIRNRQRRDIRRAYDEGRTVEEAADAAGVRNLVRAGQLLSESGIGASRMRWQRTPPEWNDYLQKLPGPRK